LRADGLDLRNAPLDGQKVRSTRIFLVRHGETEWNAGQRFQGHLDSPLTPIGLEQAGQMAARLATRGVEIIYSSDLGRAMQTAEAVASRLGIPVHPTADLREIDCGLWTGLNYQDVRERWPEEFARWRHQPHLHRMPGGESVVQVQERGLRFLARVCRLHSGRAVCAVTHNTVIRSVICHLLRLPLSRLWEGERQANCAINLIQCRDGQMELVEIARTDHLTTVSTPRLWV